MLDPTHRLRVQARRFENHRKPTATRYTEAFRAEVVAHARSKMVAGVAVCRIARDLRLRPQTLGLWLRAEPSPPKLRPVCVDRDPRPVPTPMLGPIEVRPVVVTPAGVRVEGLDLDGVVRLVRALV